MPEATCTAWRSNKYGNLDRACTCDPGRCSQISIIPIYSQITLSERKLADPSIDWVAVLRADCADVCVKTIGAAGFRPMGLQGPDAKYAVFRRE